VNLDSNTSPDPDRAPETAQDRETGPLAGSSAEAVAAAASARNVRRAGDNSGVTDTGTGARLLVSESAPSAADGQPGNPAAQVGTRSRRCGDTGDPGIAAGQQHGVAADDASEQRSPETACAAEGSELASSDSDFADVESQVAPEQEKPPVWRLIRRRRWRSTETQPPGPPTALTVLTSVALIVSLAAAAWFGAGWVRAAYFTDGPRAAARDAALGSAQQAAINMTSMDLDDIPGALARARSSMTGAILQSATEHEQEAESMATEAGVQMQSQVLGASVTSLNSERDHAGVLVVLRVNETESNQPDQPGNAYRYTWTLDMVDDSGTWKAEQVSSLGQPVPLNGAGDDGNAPAPGPQGGTAAPGGQPAGPARSQPPADAPPAPSPGSPGNPDAPAADSGQSSADTPASHGTAPSIPRSGDQEV